MLTRAQDRQIASSRQATIRRVAYPGEFRQGRHHHSFASITLVLAGGFQEITERKETEVPPLSLIQRMPGIEHSTRTGQRGADTIQITFTDPELLAYLPEYSYNRFATTAIRGFFDALRNFERSGNHRDQDTGLVDLLTNFTPGSRPFTASPPDWLARVAKKIDGLFLQGPSVSAIAGELGIHPVYLARRFKDSFGSSITTRVRELRLQHAANLLRDTGQSLSSVAQNCGFTDQSHFCRVFRKTTGITPGAFRKLGAPLGSKWFESFNTTPL